MRGTQGVGKKKQLEMMERRSKVAKAWLQGQPLAELATRFGVTNTTIHADINYLLRTWLKDEIKGVARAKMVALRRLELSAAKALDAFERSQQSIEKIVTTYKNVRCDACKGTGFVPDTVDWCDECKGEGFVVREEVVRTLVGQAGDAALLGEFRKAVETMSKIRNLFPQQKVFMDQRKQLQVNQTLTIDYTKAPADVLLEARRVLQKLSDSMGNGQVIEAEVVSGPDVAERSD